MLRKYGRTDTVLLTQTSKFINFALVFIHLIITGLCLFFRSISIIKYLQDDIFCALHKNKHKNFFGKKHLCEQLRNFLVDLTVN